MTTNMGTSGNSDGGTADGAVAPAGSSPSASVGQFNPGDVAGAASDGSRDDDTAVSPSQGGQGSSAEAGGQGSDPSDLKQQLEAANAKLAEIKARNGQLQTELSDAINRRQTKAKTNEQLSAELAGLKQQIEDDRLQREADTRRAGTVEAVLAKVPAEKRATAKLAIQGLENDARRIDLAGQDQAATQEAVMKRLREEHGDLLVAPSQQLRAPKIQGAKPGPNGVPSPTVEGVYTNEKGQRVL